jgi:hypothetical protein
MQAYILCVKSLSSSSILIKFQQPKKQQNVHNETTRRSIGRGVVSQIITVTRFFVSEGGWVDTLFPIHLFRIHNSL